MPQKKNDTKWYIIWVVITLIIILIYPNKTIFVSGWLPTSMLITFGLMGVVFIIAAFFADDQLPEDQNRN